MAATATATKYRLTWFCSSQSRDMITPLMNGA